MKTNLADLVSEITRQEGLKDKSNVAQVAEIIALLGIRWRAMSTEKAISEFNCIVERAGKGSEHSKT